jgi:type VI secretion system secreted protein VgrG
VHAGTEVLLVHVDGDPDRPIIVASVPNAMTPSPVTQSNATQSMIATRTGILVTFDDAAEGDIEDDEEEI